MQRNPRAFLAAAATILRPTTAAVPFPRALQRIRPQAPLRTRRSHSLSTTSTCYYRNDAFDIKDLPGAYSYVLDAPGFRASDFTLQLLAPQRWIKVTGECREDKDAGACRYIRKARSMGKLECHFGLEHDADMSRVSAVCRDGLLTVTIDKVPSPPASVGSAKTIEVKSS